MHFFFIVLGLILIVVFWRAFFVLAIIALVVGGIGLAIIAHQPSVTQSQTTEEFVAQMRAHSAAAKQQAAAAHEAARPAECRKWVAPTPVTDASGVQWLARADLEHATLCSEWEANAAAAIKGSSECHRLPGSWNYSVGMYQDEMNARVNRTWCIIPATLWPAERPAWPQATPAAPIRKNYDVPKLRLSEDPG
jgi:hypothetical protein